jgi:hypothetical protein
MALADMSVLPEWQVQQLRDDLDANQPELAQACPR